MKKTGLFVLLSLMIVIVVVGCATAPVKLKQVAGAPKVDISNINYLIVTVSTAENLEMTSEDLSRMESRIVQAIKEKHQNITVLDKNEITVPKLKVFNLGVKFLRFRKMGLFSGPKTEAEVVLSSENKDMLIGTIKGGVTFSEHLEATPVKSPLLWATAVAVVFGGPLVTGVVGGVYAATLIGPYQEAEEKAFVNRLIKFLSHEKKR